MTESGSTLGTLAYMSPEQLRGEELDERSDLFSFGLVLYEMATGRRAFSGATAAVIGAAILHDEPVPPRAVRSDVPEPLERAILKAIEKDRTLRYQHASELRADLLRLKRDTESSRHSVVSGAVAPPARTPRSKTVAAGVVLLAVAALLGGAYSYFHRSASLTDKDTIVLADFKNTTGDDVFDDTLRRGLAVQLEQSPYLSLISDDGIKKTLGLMGRPADTRLTPEIAREVCERTGSAAVLDGSIAPLGTKYVLGLHASNCRSGDALDDEQVQAASKEDVLTSLSDIAKTFRGRVGESLATVDKHSTPLAEATTPSIEALKAFSAAFKISIAQGTAPALPLFKRATELDPQFAFAHAHLGLSYSAMGEAARAAESTARAYELRNRASDPERFFIATMYDRQVTGNLERELETLTLWAETYPRDAVAHGLIAGFASNGTGKYELCLSEASKAAALDPGIIYSYISLAGCNLNLDRIDDAERAWHLAVDRSPANRDVQMLGYHLAFLKGDRERMDRQAEATRKIPGLDDVITHAEALVLARSGRVEAATKMLQRAADIAERAGHHEAAATYVVSGAAWDAFFDMPNAARESAASALRLSKGRDPEYVAGVAFALAGDVGQAQPIAADLEKRYPEDTCVQSNYLPTLRALFSLHAGQPLQALEQLEPARAYESADPAINFLANFGSMYPVYVRGEAYLAAGKNVEAAGEFQKILDHRGLVLADPMGARARLELARAWAAAGDSAKAKAAYEDFLALWKDADAGLAILKQAHTEDAALR